MSTKTTSFTTSHGQTFKVGEWCVADYEIWLIKDVRTYDTWTSVTRSNGFISSSGSADSCFKLNMTTKVIADGVARYYRKLHDLPGESTLNWPEICGKLRLFAEEGYLLDIANPHDEDADEATQEERCEAFNAAVWEPLEAFYQGIVKALEASREHTVQGVRVIGR